MAFRKQEDPRSRGAGGRGSGAGIDRRCGADPGRLCVGAGNGTRDDGSTSIGSDKRHPRRGTDGSG